MAIYLLIFTKKRARSLPQLAKPSARKVGTQILAASKFMMPIAPGQSANLPASLYKPPRKMVKAFWRSLNIFFNFKMSGWCRELVLFPALQ